MGVSCGLSCEEFYKMNPKKLLRYSPYYKAMLRKKLKDRDEVCWLSGVYVLKAIGACFKKKYPQKPLNVYGIGELIDYAEEEAEEGPSLDALRFMAWADAYNRQHFGTKSEEPFELETESEVKSNGSGQAVNKD